jgi:hypothetical protein
LLLLLLLLLLLRMLLLLCRMVHSGYPRQWSQVPAAAGC